MFWEKKYEDEKYMWGEGPSELGKITLNYLRKNKLVDEKLKILDLGCGYGRDSFHLAKNINCNVTGIDASEKAINLAKNTLEKIKLKNVKFIKCKFEEVEGEYDIIFLSNFYQILKKNERRMIREKLKTILANLGLLFLSTLSVNDPEHFGKGKPIAGESNSYILGTYAHFCTKNELLGDFHFLEIKELFEFEYFEPRSNGVTHHHKSWILIGQIN